jgi:hypothetical protein
MRDDASAHMVAFDWEDAANEESVIGLVPPAGFSVSPRGWQCLEQTQLPALPPGLHERVSKLVSIEFYDSAVRETAIFLEEKLRSRSQSSAHGQALVSRYVHMISSRAGGYGAFQRHIRSELRTFFAFVRNEFAHKLLKLQPARCHSLLHRAATILDMLQDGDDGVSSFQDIVGRKAAPP